MDVSFWKGRKVLVTGHTGFKGAWLTHWLHSLEAEVLGFSLPPSSTPNLFDLAQIQHKSDSRIGDIRDASLVTSAFSSWRPEVVFHLAAQSLVHRGYKKPLETFETNVMGTANVLEAIGRTNSVEAAVIVTTDKVYQNEDHDEAFEEGDRLGGKDPYSSSKACAELVTTCYRDSYLRNGDNERHQAPVATARAGNVIGGGDWSEDRLIPDLVRSAAAGTATEIRRPEATRPWQHVLEPLGAYLHLAEQLVKHGDRVAKAWNFGPSDADTQTVRWVLERMIALWSGPLEWKMDPLEHPPEASTLRLDCSLAEQELGWRPILPLSEALEWLVEWYVNHLDGGDAEAKTQEQIARYQTRLLATQESA